MSNTGQYFEVLTVHRPPEPLESFTSYLTRLAEMNGIRSMTGLAAVSSFESRPSGNALRSLKDYPPPSFGTLELITGSPGASLLQTTFYHLAKKFGRSTDNSLFSGFLFKSLGNSLRFCSACLNERPYYSLPWRFLRLQGCYKHACKLFERCPYCEREIPFIALPLKIGICPACKGDLRLCTSGALTEEERREAFIFSQEVEFLLSPQIWEDTYTSIAKNVGREYALLRQMKGYSAAEVKSRMSVVETSSKIAAIDFGRSEGATLQDYAAYAECLEVSLQDMFCLMLTRVEGDTCFDKLRREYLPPEEYILERAQLIVNGLESEGKQVTRQAIREELHISESSLRRYPHVKDFLDQRAGIFHYQRKKLVREHKDEVFNRALEAIEYLRNQGKPITFNSIGEIVGLPALNLRAYPRVVALIKELSNFREFQKEQYLRRESDLLVQVQDAMHRMRNRGQLITMSAIARELGTHVRALQWYRRVKEFLEQEVTVSTESRKRIVQSREREKEFLRLVEDAVQRLVEEGQKISRKTVSDFIGVSVQTLTRFPQVKLFLEEKITFYQQIYALMKENELLERVKDAIEALEAQGNKVTQQTIASAVGVTRTTLKQFPRVVCLLEGNRRMQAQIRENKLMIKVKEAVRVLEENDCNITNGAICKQLGIDNSNLHHYPSVIVFVQNTVKEKQKRDK